MPLLIHLRTCNLDATAKPRRTSPRARLRRSNTTLAWRSEIQGERLLIFTGGSLEAARLSPGRDRGSLTAEAIPSAIGQTVPTILVPGNPRFAGAGGLMGPQRDKLLRLAESAPSIRPRIFVEGLRHSVPRAVRPARSSSDCLHTSSGTIRTLSTDRLLQRGWDDSSRRISCR